MSTSLKIFMVKGTQLLSDWQNSLCCAPPGWLSGERVRLMTCWLRVRFRVEATFHSGLFPPLTSAEACEKSSRWLWEKKLF